MILRPKQTETLASVSTEGIDYAFAGTLTLASIRGAARAGGSVIKSTF